MRTTKTDDIASLLWGTVTVTGISIWLLILLVAMIMALSGCSSPSNIYTAPLDPNRPMYKFLSKPSDSWVKAFGDEDGNLDERAAIGYQLALGRQQRGSLRKMIVDVNDAMAVMKKTQMELEDTQLWLMKVIGRDPNSN